MRSCEVRDGDGYRRGMNRPVLVALAGRPGTGKTTLARALAAALDAVYLRIDAIETAVIRSGLARPVGTVGYVVAHEVARSNLLLGKSVVVDAVNPVSDARKGWRVLASEIDVPLIFFETILRDREEHRRRVAARWPDLADQSVPTWEQVEAIEYESWATDRDGPRSAIDTTDADAALATALAHLGP
jgi:predicted kinase